MDCTILWYLTADIATARIYSCCVEWDEDREGRAVWEIGDRDLPGNPLLPSRDGSPPERVRPGKVARAGSWAGLAASYAAGSVRALLRQQTLAGSH